MPNTINLKKSDYTKLEEIIKKIASENKIENVKEIHISLSKDTGIIKFGIAGEQFPKPYETGKPVEETSKKNDLAESIGMDSNRVEDFFFKQIPIGFIGEDKIDLSVQGSKMHGSIPKETVPLEDYEAMEVAILIDDGWASKNALERVGIPIEGLKEFGYSPATGGVFSYVKIDKIKKLYNYLKQYADVEVPLWDDTDKGWTIVEDSGNTNKDM